APRAALHRRGSAGRVLQFLRGDHADPCSCGGGVTGGAPGSQRRASRLVDIAEAVGVHVFTVSWVLNGDFVQSISPEVYELILKTARQQGYRSNALARALKRRRTNALAFVIPLLRNPIWVRLQRGALQRAGERGYVVMIMEEPGEH